MQYYTVDHYQYNKLAKLQPCKRPRGNNGGKTKSNPAADIVCAFDIETSKLPDYDHSVMYVWQFAFNHDVIVGRTWDEYEFHLSMIRQNLPEGVKLVIYVHNLSYEFQQLRNIYSFKPQEVFCIESRKILKCEMWGCIEYRCSYLLTNMSLAEAAKKFKVNHQKQSGEDFDYDATRYPWSPLSEEQLKYAIYDVLAVVEVVQALMQRDGDNLNTIPLTSTGYVRRDVKAHTRDIRKYVQGLAPDYDLYRMLKWVFRGGDTHANKMYAGRIVHDVDSWDISSSYPFAMACREFPVQAFARSGAISLEKYHEFVNTRHKAMLLKLEFVNIRLKEYFTPVPYLSRAKCDELPYEGLKCDNGRICEAQHLITCCTDIDFRILESQYKWDNLIIVDSYYSTYGMLPESLRGCVLRYYRDKTELKDVPGREGEYNRAKAHLNSIYGMSVQDPVKLSVLFDEADPFALYHIDATKTAAEVLGENNAKSFTAYQWGVWVTAWARYHLHEAINIVGNDAMLYCDTDSVKYAAAAKPDFTALNAERRRMAERWGAFADDPQGVRHYMGVFEQERSYAEFVTFGAKKYAFRYAGEEDITACRITIAGVAKAKGAEELQRSGGLAALTEGYIFREAGGLEVVYNDRPLGWVEVEGRELYVGVNTCLLPSTYTLSLTDEYSELISECAMKLDFRTKLF